VNRRWVIEPRAPWEMHFDAVTTLGYAFIIGPWWPAVVWLACIKLGLLYASVKWGVLRVRQVPPQYEAALLVRMQRVLRWATAAGVVSTAVLNAHLIGIWSLFTIAGTALALPAMQGVCAAQSARCTRNAPGAKRCRVFDADVAKPAAAELDTSRWSAVERRWVRASTAQLVRRNGFDHTDGAANGAQDDGHGAGAGADAEVGAAGDLLAADARSFLDALVGESLTRDACYAPFAVAAIGSDVWRADDAAGSYAAPPPHAGAVRTARAPGGAAHASSALAGAAATRTETVNPVVAALTAAPVPVPAPSPSQSPRTAVAVVAAPIAFAAAPGAAPFVASEPALATLAAMGFTDRAVASCALQRANGDVSAAATSLIDSLSM
jgi:hypothetical protein